ncbi:Protein often near L-alanine-DL-glutamate epimerase (cell wall recycling) [Olavius algarvensis Delta 1 endosymbiont]|nr:Protein often near L-alanine-DL-glutamate epimerase (cell wall recycling) [Olavius algarvensis Delta 1 endosymbiont]
MKSFLDGNAIVYCEGMFNAPSGKTAHGLVRLTKRYRILSVIDSRHAGRDAGQILDGRTKDIPIFGSLERAVRAADRSNRPATHFVVGMAPDGGRLPSEAKQDIEEAITFGLNIDCGLHDYLSEDLELVKLAKKYGSQIRDIRKPAPIKSLHFFDGKIEAVRALKIAVLGTDSAVGKRTTAWLLVNDLQDSGVRTEMIGTGQTAWMQGVKYGTIMDSLVNDFVAGEIEHAVWTAWQNEQPEVIVIEGQGSLMNPAYPGGFEILAAGRPDIIVLQHAPARKEYDGFPGYRIQPLAKQIAAIELLSGKPVVAVTVNHENLPDVQIPLMCDAIEQAVGLPTFDLLRDGPDELANLIKSYADDPIDQRKAVS